EDMRKLNYTALFVNAFDAGETPLFAAIAMRLPGNPAWQLHSKLTSHELQEKLAELSDRGFRLTSINGYRYRNETRFATLWLNDGNQSACKPRQDLTSTQYQAVITDCEKNGMRPVFVSGYPARESYRFAVILGSDSIPWVARHDLSTRE